MMESFFGILKSEMFMAEKTFKSIKEIEGQSSIMIIATTNESK